MVDGLMSTGDVGRFGDDGRLYVEGRDDEMIVSGGENVFPKEVEDCLSRHEHVVEAAAIGVDDDDFGKRLRAFVVVDDDLLHRGRPQGAGSRRTSPATRCRARSSSLDELPRNATGKVLKRELVEWEPDGQDDRTGRTGERRRVDAGGLRLGGLAPDFTLRDQFGQDVTPVVLPRHARRWRWSSTPTRSPGSAPARWPASATAWPSS